MRKNFTHRCTTRTCCIAHVLFDESVQTIDGILVTVVGVDEDGAHSEAIFRGHIVHQIGTAKLHYRVYL